MSLPPEILFDEKSLMRLKAIADSSNASRVETIEALIYAAYYLPHEDWDKILRIYRDYTRQKRDRR